MKTTVMTDQELIQQYVAGSETAVEQLILKYKNKVYTTIYLTVKDSYLAEDLFQDTFIKAIETIKLGKYNDEGKFLPWVLRIAHNLCIDYFRKQKRTQFVQSTDDFDVFDVLGVEDESMEDKMVREQTENNLKHLIDKLPEEQKEVLMLRHYYDYSFKEIADMTNTSINTSLGRMRYALINLRKLLDSTKIKL